MADRMEEYLKLAVTAAKSAARHVQGKYRDIEVDLEHDVKIRADREMDAELVKTISGHSEFSILTEETGFKKGKNEDFCWIVDPLDGSLNYSRGWPLCCVSIALWKDKEPRLGVIYDFNRDEMFTAIKDKGAWLNGWPITVSRTEEKGKAILCTGFPAALDLRTLPEFIENVRKYKKVRLLGTAALSLAYVACGRADGYHEKGIRLWDVAAGVLLVEAAGGKVLMNSSSDQDSYEVKATNGIL